MYACMHACMYVACLCMSMCMHACINTYTHAWKVEYIYVMDAAVALNPSLIALYWKEPDTSSNNGTGSGGARLPSCFVRGASHDPMRITIHIAVSTGAEEGGGGENMCVCVFVSLCPFI